METSYVIAWNNASRQTSIYLNIINIILGFPGAFFNIIVFLSLKTFRENTCGFYLTIMSFLNICHLLAGSLSLFVIAAFEIDWGTTSTSLCKFQTYLTQWSTLTSLTCLCLATIDQYLATNRRVHWQEFSNIKLTHRLAASTIIFWSIYSILYAVFYEIITLNTENTALCTTSNDIFYQYTIYFNELVLTGFLPNGLTALFAYLLYRNLKTITYRTIPLVRRELDKQFSNMLLIQVIYNVCVLLFYNIINVTLPYLMRSTNSVTIARTQFLHMLSVSIYNSYSSVSHLRRK